MVKRGRKPGSTNKRYEPTTDTQAPCMKCGSYSIKAMRGAVAKETMIPGVRRDGTRYVGYRTIRSVCQCGQAVFRKIYLTESTQRKENAKRIINTQSAGDL